MRFVSSLPIVLEDDIKIEFAETRKRLTVRCGPSEF
jgi:hypothetical protein